MVAIIAVAPHRSTLFRKPVQGFPEHYPGVFDQVVFVHLQISRIFLLNYALPPVAFFILDCSSIILLPGESTVS
jgi:hypothetical protein